MSLINIIALIVTFFYFQETNTDIIRYKGVEYEVSEFENLISFERIVDKKFRKDKKNAAMMDANLNGSGLNGKSNKELLNEVQTVIDNYFNRNKFDRSGKLLFINVAINKQGRLILTKIILNSASRLRIKEIEEIENELKKIKIEPNKIRWQDQMIYAPLTLKIQI